MRIDQHLREIRNRCSRSPYVLTPPTILFSAHDPLVTEGVSRLLLLLLDGLRPLHSLGCGPEVSCWKGAVVTRARSLWLRRVLGEEKDPPSASQHVRKCFAVRTRSCIPPGAYPCTSGRRSRSVRSQCRCCGGR